MALEVVGREADSDSQKSRWSSSPTVGWQSDDQAGTGTPGRIQASKQASKTAALPSHAPRCQHMYVSTVCCVPPQPHTTRDTIFFSYTAAAAL